MKTLRHYMKVLLFVGLIAGNGITFAAEGSAFDGMTVMALGPVDGRAVLKLPSGKMKVLKVGDVVPGTNATVQQVLPDRLVVVDRIERAGEPTINQSVWIYKATKAGATSRVQRLDTEGPSKPLIQVPIGGVVQ